MHICIFLFPNPAPYTRISHTLQAYLMNRVRAGSRTQTSPSEREGEVCMEKREVCMGGRIRKGGERGAETSSKSRAPSSSTSIRAKRAWILLDRSFWEVKVTSDCVKGSNGESLVVHVVRQPLVTRAHRSGACSRATARVGRGEEGLGGKQVRGGRWHATPHECFLDAYVEKMNALDAYIET